MLTASQVAIAAYVHAMTQAFAPASPPGRALAEWLHTNQCFIGLDFQAAMARATPNGTPPADPDLEKPLPPALWTELRDAVGRSKDAPAPEPDAVAAGIATLRRRSSWTLSKLRSSDSCSTSTTTTRSNGCAATSWKRAHSIPVD